MSVFSGKTSDGKYDDLISAEIRSIKKSDKVLSAMERKLKADKRTERKKTVIKMLHRVASKPISQKDGMEMMFGVQTFKKVNDPSHLHKLGGR